MRGTDKHAGAITDLDKIANYLSKLVPKIAFSSAPITNSPILPISCIPWIFTSRYLFFNDKNRRASKNLRLTSSIVSKPSIFSPRSRQSVRKEWRAWRCSRMLHVPRDFFLLQQASRKLDSLWKVNSPLSLLIPPLSASLPSGHELKRYIVLSSVTFENFANESFDGFQRKRVTFGHQKLRTIVCSRLGPATKKRQENKSDTKRLDSVLFPVIRSPYKGKASAENWIF